MTMLPVGAALAAICSAAALLVSCSALPTPQAGSPFQSGRSTTVQILSAPSQAPGSDLSQSAGDPTDLVTATVTVTGTKETTQQVDSGPASTAPGTNATSITEPTTTAPATTATTTSSAPLNYSTTVPAPPTPIGAAGTKTSSTETMETVTPTAMPKAPYPAIATPTRIPRPADTARTNPVQLAAAFVSLMEAPKSTDSRADTATLRATPFATTALREQLAAQSGSAADQQPGVGYVQVTVRSAVVTGAALTGAAKTVTVAVLYDQLTIISPSSNFNGQKLLLRICTLQKGDDGKWLVSGYRHGAN